MALGPASRWERGLPAKTKACGLRWASQGPCLGAGCGQASPPGRWGPAVSRGGAAAPAPECCSGLPVCRGRLCPFLWTTEVLQGEGDAAVGATKREGEGRRVLTGVEVAQHTALLCDLCKAPVQCWMKAP